MPSNFIHVLNPYVEAALSRDSRVMHYERKELTGNAGSGRDELPSDIVATQVCSVRYTPAPGYFMVNQNSIAWEGGVREGAGGGGKPRILSRTRNQCLQFRVRAPVCNRVPDKRSPIVWRGVGVPRRQHSHADIPYRGPTSKKSGRDSSGAALSFQTNRLVTGLALAWIGAEAAPMAESA